MINKKISTIAGSLIILAIAIILGFSFLVSNKKEEIKSQNNVVLNNSGLGDKEEIKQEEEKVIENNENQKIDNKTSSKTIHYKSNESTPVLSTTDWNFHAVEKNLNDKPLFEFEYPANWSLDGSVFSSNGNKIAEITPAGIIILKDNQHCFDVDFKTEYPDLIKLISKNKFKIGNVEGVLRITKVPITPATWFPNSYCIEKDGKALILTFYEKDQNSPNKKIFESIVSTVNFSN